MKIHSTLVNTSAQLHAGYSNAVTCCNVRIFFPFTVASVLGINYQFNLIPFG